MNGHHQVHQQPKKSTKLTILKQKHKNDQQQAPTTPDPLPLTIDVDQLAREKVVEIEEALEHLTSLKLDALNTWFSILKQIITAADLHRTNDGKKKDENGPSNKHETGDSIYADYGDDNEHFTAHVDLSEQFATNSVKWTIRVRAFKIVHRLVQLLGKNNVVSKLSSSVLVKLLPDLVRLAFVAATSPYDELKMQGFEMFKYLIEKFAAMEEEEFPGHSILEQYKTQVLSAVKPAFNLDAPPYITAIASQICSLWICHGLEREFVDIKRTYQLMLLSIEKLNGQGSNQHSKLYTESELEQERVDILGSWAQLDIASVENDEAFKLNGRLFRLTDMECTNLKSLICPQVDSLVDRWWEALKDYALLIMPSPKSIGIMHDNEHVYTREVALKLFEPVWPKLVLAQTYRLVMSYKLLDPIETKYAQFLCGIILRELSRFVISIKSSKQNVQILNSTLLSLRSLHSLLSNSKMDPIFQKNLAIAREFYAVLYDLTVCHVADQSFRLLLKSTLDKLFTLIFNKISQDQSCVYYALAKLISLLMTTMKDIEIACKQESQADLESNRIQLVLCLKNLVSIIKNAPKSTLDEAVILEAMITVFQEMLRFDHDRSVSLSLLDQLHHLYPMMPDSRQAYMINELCPEFKIQIESIVSSTAKQMVELKETDKVILMQLGAIFKAFRYAIEHSDAANRNELLISYVEINNRAISDLGGNKDQLTKDKTRRELVDFFIDQVSTIKKDFSTEIENQSFNKELLHRYECLAKLQKEVKDEIESKNEDLLNAKKLTSSKSGLKKPQAAKITLKADFSNFYAPKKT